MRSVFILLVALQLLFSRFISFESPSSESMHFRLPTPTCIYVDSYVLTLGLYLIDAGVCLRCGNRPEHTSSGHYSASLW